MVCYEKEGAENYLGNPSEIMEKNNEHLREAITVEKVALKLGINQNDPFDWVNKDGEFSQTLASLIEC